ncbi:hypothetical protein EJB05_30605, partial [Eragrostis curvula]
KGEGGKQNPTVTHVVSSDSNRIDRSEEKPGGGCGWTSSPASPIEGTIECDYFSISDVHGKCGQRNNPGAIQEQLSALQNCSCFCCTSSPCNTIMGRKKVNLQRITNDASRRIVFNKRSQMLMKKTSELVTLCRIKACVVIYDENGEHPQVWPSVEVAKEMMTSYKDMPDVPQWKKKTTQEEYLMSRINSLQNQMKRSEEGIKDCEAQILFHDAVAGRRPGLVGVTSDELARLSVLVEDKKKKLLKRMEQLGIAPPEQPPPQQQQPQPQQQHIQASIQEPQHHMLTVPSPATSLGYGAFAGNSSGAGPSTGTTSLSYYGAFAGNSTGNTSLGCSGIFAGNSNGAGPSTGNTSLGCFGAFAGNISGAGPSTGNTSLGFDGVFAGNSSGAGPSTGNTSLGCDSFFAGNSGGAGPGTGNTSLGCYGIFAGNSSGAGPSTGNTSLGCYGIFADNINGAGPSTANTNLGCYGIFADNISGAGPSTANTSLGAFAGNSSGAGPSTTSISHGGGDIVQPPLNQGIWPWNSFIPDLE